MDLDRLDTDEGALPTESADLDPYDPDIKGVGEFKDIELSPLTSDPFIRDRPEARADENAETAYQPASGSLESIVKNAVKTHIAPTSIDEDEFWEGNNKWVVVIAFTLCFVSNMVGHLIREPLFTTKVNIQKSFGTSTLNLSYLDISYLSLYGVGHMVTPIAVPRAHAILYVSFLHMLLALSHFMLYLFNNLAAFVVLYGVTGFAVSSLWLSLYNDLHAWLPAKLSLTTLTFWCCAAETGRARSPAGLVLGTLMCAHIQTETRWKVLFLITSLVNLGTSWLLFTCYHKPNPGDDPETLEVYAPPDKLFDPSFVGRKNLNVIVTALRKAYSESPQQLELDTLPGSSAGAEAAASTSLPSFAKFAAKKVDEGVRRTFKLSARVLRKHMDVLRRVDHLALCTLGYSSLRSARNCFSFWISFYLTTNLKYSIRRGIYATLVFQLGSCIGSVTAGLMSKVALKSLHMAACTFAALASFLTLSSIYLIDLNGMWKAFAYVFLVGLATNCAELLVTTRGLKALCEQAEDDEDSDYSVSLGTTFSISTFVSVVQGYISIFIAHHLGWNAMFLYLSLMTLVSVGAFFVPARDEFVRIKQYLMS